MSDQENPNEDEAWKNRHEDDDEDFGLPEVNFDLDDDEGTESAQEEETAYGMAETHPEMSETQMSEEEEISERERILAANLDLEEEEEDEKGGGAWVWIAVVVMILLAGVAIWLWFGQSDDPEPVVETTPSMEIEEPEPEPEPIPEPEPEPIKTEGDITTINTRNGRYYVVVGSFVDEDLAMDYAKKLSKDGLDITILAPLEGMKGYSRVAVDSYSAYSEADARAKDLRSSFPNGTWATRY